MHWTQIVLITSSLLLVAIPFKADLKQSLSVTVNSVIDIEGHQRIERSDTYGDGDEKDDREADVFDDSGGSSSTNHLMYIGCYDVWEKKDATVLDRMMERNTIDECLANCHIMLHNGIRLFGLRGDSCFCPHPATLPLVRVKDSYCPTICSGANPPLLENGARTCGGNYSMSLYCSTNNEGDCLQFLHRPIENLYEETTVPVPEAVSNEKEDSLPLPTPTLAPGHKIIRCANCTWCFGTLRPSFDYIPNNTPESCSEYCRRRITYVKFENNKTREPCLYALAGWRNHSRPHPACGCTSTLEEIFELPPEFCDAECPIGGKMCGSTVHQFAVNIYLTGIDLPEEGHPQPFPTTDTAGTDPTTTTAIEPDPTTTTEVRPDPTSSTTEPPSTTESVGESDGDPTTTTELFPPPTQTPSNPECSGQTQCRADDPYGITWMTCPGDTQFQKCPNEASGDAYWKCLSTGTFEGETPNYSNCTTQWVHQLEEKLQVAPPGSAVKILTEVEVLCTKAKMLENTAAQYFGHEIFKIVKIVEGVVKDGNLTATLGFTEFEEMTKEATLIGDSVLTNPRTWKQLSGADLASTVTSFIRTLDEVNFELATEAEAIGREDYTKVFGCPTVSVQAGLVSLDKVGPHDTLKFESGRSFIELPPGWVNVLPTDHLLAQFSGLAILTQNGNPFPTQSDSVTAEDRKDFNGKIMSFSLIRPIENVSITFPGDGVTIRIFHDVLAWGDGQRKVIRRKLHDGEEPKAILGSAVCAYWDTVLGIWSQDGCKLIDSIPEHTHCECSHLTSFAVLFSYYDYVEKSLALEVLTIILCSLSIISLMATILIFTKVRATHGVKTTITKNLAFCLLIGNTLMLFVVDRNYFNMSEDFCLGAGILTHYVFLCAFMWMAVEGFQLYKMMVHVFDSGHSHLTLIRVLAYGFPVLIVLLTGIIGLALNGVPYGGEEFCWLNGNFTLAFLVPAGIVICGNLVVLCITLRTAYHMKRSQAPVHDWKKSYRTWVRGCFSITILLGVTWVVGYIQMFGSVASEVAAYVFTILNASQGFLLFIYHCMMNEKVRMAAERKNIRYPAWFLDSLTNTNTTTGVSPNSSRFGGQNVKSFYSDSGAPKASKKISSGGALEAFSANRFKHPAEGSGVNKNLSKIVRNGNGTLSSSSSSTTISTGTESQQSGNDLLRTFRRNRFY